MPVVAELALSASLACDFVHYDLSISFVCRKRCSFSQLVIASLVRIIFTNPTILFAEKKEFMQEPFKISF